MNKIIKIAIIILIIMISIWNILGEAKANNYLIENELSINEKQIREYKKWIKINPKPYKVNFTIEGLDWNSEPIIGDDSKIIETISNELKENIKPSEIETYGEVYINDVAASIFKQNSLLLLTRNRGNQNTAFPIGSIIVREKLIKKDLVNSFDVISLAVMIKHDSSFNPRSNGWQFLYLHPNTFSITKNDQPLCLSCHESKLDNDFVFRSYLLKE